jgi:hypothetical protein
MLGLKEQKDPESDLFESSTTKYSKAYYTKKIN